MSIRQKLKINNNKPFFSKFSRVRTVFDLLEKRKNNYYDACQKSELKPMPLVWSGGGDIERYKRYTHRSRPLRLFGMPNIIVFAHGVIADCKGRVLHQGEFFSDEVLSINHPVNKLSGAFEKSHDEKYAILSDSLEIRTIIDPCMILAQCGTDVYGHWLLDVVTKIPLSWMLPAEVKIVLPKLNFQWQMDFLRLLGVDQDRLITYDPRSEALSVRHAVIASGLRDVYALHPFSNIAFEALRASVSSQGCEPLGAGKKLYVSRRKMNTYNQSLMNSEQISDILSKRGFQIIEPETLPIAEQIQRFANADIVVGEQGSALHNTAFSPRGIRVISLNSEKAQYFAQAGLGCIRSQPTGFIFGRYISEQDKSRNLRVFEIDARVLCSALDEIGA